MATTCQPLTYRRLQTQLQPTGELNHPSLGKPTWQDAMLSWDTYSCPEAAHRGTRSSPVPPDPKLKTCLGATSHWNVAQAHWGQNGEKPPKTLQAMRVWEASGMTSQLGPVITSCCCGSKHMQSVYLVNSMGGRVKEVIVKGHITSWKPWEWKEDAHHFQYMYINIFSHKEHSIPVFSSVLPHAFVFLKAAVPVAGYFLPLG